MEFKQSKTEMNNDEGDGRWSVAVEDDKRVYSKPKDWCVREICTKAHKLKLLEVFCSTKN